MPESVITTVPNSLFRPIATGAPLKECAVTTSPFFPNCRTTVVAVFGFHELKPAIAPLETKVTHEFVPLATNAVDLER